MYLSKFDWVIWMPYEVCPAKRDQTTVDVITRKITINKTIAVKIVGA